MQRRRGNKSSKVPNVKLRPAGSSAMAAARKEAPSTSGFWEENTQEIAVEDSVSCPRPFKGMVICATGTIDKAVLQQQATELGAAFSDSLTNFVTHLVASDHGGEKYLYALEHRIPIVNSTWVAECFAIWLRGDDFEVAESITRHRLPLFNSVVLSTSGITKILDRTKISKEISDRGGIYAKDIERPVKVTHLLCSGDEVTEKMEYARKFNARKEANIHLVREEWFWACIAYGGRFPEREYSVDRPRPTRTAEILVRTEPPSSHLGSSKPSAADDDEDEEQVASVNRTAAITLHVWESLLKPRGYHKSGDRLRPPVTVRPQSTEFEAEFAQVDAVSARKGKLNNNDVLSSFRRANSFVTPTASSSRAPFSRLPSRAASNISAETQSTSHNDHLPFFSGLSLRIVGEANTPAVCLTIEAHGGVILTQNDNGVADFIVVRLISGSKFYLEETDEKEKIKYRTECWLERCMFEESICPPEQHISFVPVGVETPVEGFSAVTLSVSGLDQAEIHWVQRLCNALGIMYAATFSRNSTHLLCPSGTGPKATMARDEWNIPVVGMSWLEEICRIGVIPPAREHLVETDSAADISLESSGARSQDYQLGKRRSEGRDENNILTESRDKRMRSSF